MHKTSKGDLGIAITVYTGYKKSEFFRETATKWQTLKS